MNKDLIELLTEFDELGYEPTTLTENPEIAAVDWKNRLIKAIEAENAVLRKRLNKAIELPFEIGITVFIVKEKNFLWKETHIATGKITLYLLDGERLSIRVAGSYPDHDFEYTVYPNDYNKTWFTDRAAAEKRLAELGGEKNGNAT